jgi:maleate cis-trans isomerase
MAMWQPDGGGQTRIGVLTPHADIVPESEFSALAAAGIVSGNGFRAIGVIKALEEALGLPVLTRKPSRALARERLAGSRASAIGYGQIFEVI